MPRRVVACSHAKNSNLKRCGRSPYQAAHGRAPRWPGELLSDSSSALTWSGITQDEALTKADYLRSDGLKAFADVEADRELRAAIGRKTAHSKKR